MKQEQVLSPYDNFLYALKAKETKRQYPHGLDKFLSFMGFKGTIEEKCGELYHFTKISDSSIIQSYLIKFINYQKLLSNALEVSPMIRAPMIVLKAGKPTTKAYSSFRTSMTKTKRKPKTKAK